MSELPRLIYYKFDPNEEPWLLRRTADYNPETNEIRIYYAPKIKPIPNPLRRFKTLFHEFIHWSIPSYKTKYGYYFISLHALNDFFNKIVNGLIDRDKKWIFIECETKGVKELFSGIKQHHLKSYCINYIDYKHKKRGNG
jgi:hypothetical protein